MGKITFKLRSSLDKDVSIYLLLRAPGSKQIEMKTNLRVNPKNWGDDDMRPKNDIVLKEKINKLDIFLSKQIKEASLEGTTVDSAWVRRKLDSHTGKVESEDPLFVLGFYRTFLSRAVSNLAKGAGIKEGTIKSYRSLYTILEAYEKAVESRIRFDKMDKNWFEDFNDWLLNEKRYKPSNVAKQVSRLKTICREALSKGVPVNPMFSYFKLKKSNQKKFITIIDDSEFEMIKAYEPSEPYLVNARRWLLIGLCVGQRVSDLLNITKSDVRHFDDYCLIDVVQKKTGTPVTIPIKDPYVLDIVRNWGIHRISDQRFNEYIKIVCERSGIDSKTTGYIRNKSHRDELVTGPKWMFLSSHSLRRSFATNFFHKNVSTPTLMAITGHKTESVFYAYINQDTNRDKQAEEFLKHL